MRRPTAPSSDEDTDRKIGDIARVGRVESVDLAAGKAVVSFGDQLTPPIDWLMSVGDTTVWVPPTVGEQVIVLAPEGDSEQAVIVGGLPSSDFAPLFLGLKNAIRFADGTRVSCNPTTNRLDIEAVGTVNLLAPDGLNITGDTTIIGKLNVKGDATLDAKLEVAGNIHTPGTITGDTDVVANGKSGKGHKHPAGSPLTGAPQ